MSFENLLSIRPEGLESKNFMGALITFFNTMLCSRTEARIVVCKQNSKIIVHIV